MFIQILINSAKFLQLVEHGQQILWFKLGQIKDAKKRKWSYRGFPFPQFLKKQVDFESIKLHLQKFWVRSLKTSLFRLLCLFRMASAKQFITITTAALLILMRRPNPWISISSISTWVKRSRSRSRPVDTEKTLPKAQRTRGLSSAYQSNKFLHKFQNSKSQPNISISTKH